MLHKDFVSQGQTVNQIFYREVLEWFKNTILRQSTTSREHCKTSQKKTSSTALVLKGITLKFKNFSNNFVYTSSFITFWMDHVWHCSHCGWLEHNTGNVYGLNHLTSMVLFRFSCCTNSDCGLVFWHCAVLLQWNMMSLFSVSKACLFSHPLIWLATFLSTCP